LLHNNDADEQSFVCRLKIAVIFFPLQAIVRQSNIYRTLEADSNLAAVELSSFSLFVDPVSASPGRTIFV